MLLAAWMLYSRTQAGPPPLLLLAVVGGAVCVFALILWSVARARRKRREALEQFAMESGFAFSAEADPSVAQELSEVQFTLGMATPRVSYENVLRGSRQGREVIIADRTTGQGKSQSQSTVVAIRFETPLPPFYLCAENFLFHILEKIGFSDIDLEAAPEFSRRFFLHSDKPEEVRALFTADVTLAFEQLPQDAGLCVQGAGRWLAVYRGMRLTPPDQLREVLETAVRIAEALHRGQTAGAKW
ncbi:MAG TPA: hypothetical protein VMS96_09455 [Terriglobales bacterium]|nr:hypothetical protein [Terriglobales bacterium]